MKFRIKSEPEQINEINRQHKDEYGNFKRAPFMNHNEEWIRKYHEIQNTYNQQKTRLDTLKEQYQTADVIHLNCWGNDTQEMFPAVVERKKPEDEKLNAVLSL